MKQPDGIAAANALGNQINLLFLIGGGAVVIDVFRPGMLAFVPGGAGFVMIFMALNIHCYFRRLRNALNRRG